MLKLNAPIEIKSRRDFVHDNELMYERISANYSFLGREIGAEELLHLANTPPEVYVAEGDLTTVSGNTVINSRNEEKLEIINNVLNRIVLSADAHLSYQDRAYITDILYKLGIRDDRTFMNEVRRMINETREEDRLINQFLIGNMFLRNGEINEEFVSLMNRVSNLEERNEDLYLSKSIMNRLNTGAVYQIVSNFNRSVNENSLNFGEYAVTEQTDAAKKILTDRIADHYREIVSELVFREGESSFSESSEEEYRESVRERSESVREYRGGNIYERELLNGSRTEKSIKEELSSALFLSIVKNLVSNTFEKTVTGFKQHYDFTDVLYRSSSNLFNRIAYLSEEKRIAGDLYTENFRRESADITYAVTEEGSEGDTTEINESRRSYDLSIDNLLETIENLTEGSDISVNRSDSTQNIAQTDITYTGSSIEGDRTESTVNEYRDGIHRSSVDNLLETIENLKEGSSYSVNRSDSTQNETLTDITYAGTRIEGDRQTNTLNEYGDEIYRSDREVINRTENRRDESHISGDTYRSEYNTESADITYAEQVTEGESGERVREDKSFERELIRLNEKNLQSVEKYNRMMTLLKSLESRRVEKGGPERTRKDALKALDGSEDIIQSFNEEDAAEEVRREQVFREITRLFPDNTRQVFEILEQHIGNPAINLENISVQSNNLAEAAEEIRRFQERPERPQEREVRERAERQEELVFRENTSLDMEEIRENIEEIRLSSRINRSQSENILESNENTVENRNVVNTSTTTFTNQENVDIEELVSQGVRQHMGMISEQVLNKLEKRLRNEKSRRGI